MRPLATIKVVKSEVRTRMTIPFLILTKKCKSCSVKLEKLFEAFIKIGWVCVFPVVTKFYPWQVQEQRKSLKVSPNFARIETHLRMPPGLTKQTLYHTNISIILRRRSALMILCWKGPLFQFRNKVPIDCSLIAATKARCPARMRINNSNII